MGHPVPAGAHACRGRRVIPGGMGTLLFSSVSGIVLKKIAKWGLLC